MSDEIFRRDSVAETPFLIKDPKKRAEAEVENGFRQFDLAMSILGQGLDEKYPDFVLSSSIILQLQQFALKGISSFAGTYRPGPVDIKGSKHKPPDSHLVPKLVEELCDFVNEGLYGKNKKSPFHLAAYIMWRLNWIHPFADGNGRTSRMTSYLVLCAALKSKLPGTKTIPDFIAEESREAYYDALEAADRSWRERKEVNLSEMENLLENLLARQLLTVIEDAKNTKHPKKEKAGE